MCYLNARFFIALCHVHLDNEVEAEHALAAIHRERPSDQNAAYLLAYIRIRRDLDVAKRILLDARLHHAAWISPRRREIKRAPGGDGGG